MAVFDDFVRTDSAPSRHAEGHARFLNRANTPFWAAVRALIEEWFARYPADEQADMRARLRSGDDRQSHAAFFELYLHETLTRAGYRVTCHPHLPGTSRRPDFLVEGDTDFYVEARAVSSPDEDVAGNRRRSKVYDALDRLHSPNFFLWIEVDEEGSADLRTSVLRKRLQRWLDALDPDDPAASSTSYEALPAFAWVDAGWEVSFRAIAKKPEARGKPGARPLGAFGPGQAAIVDDASPLRAALADKGSAYGVLDRPFVIALRTSGGSDDFDIMNVLYGTSTLSIATGPGGPKVAKEFRAPDGYWYGGTEWRHRHVSGVLLMRSLQPWGVARDVPVLWEHPDPIRPVVAPLIWARACAGDGEIERHDPAVLPHELLGVALDWPGVKPFPD